MQEPGTAPADGYLTKSIMDKLPNLEAIFISTDDWAHSCRVFTARTLKQLRNISNGERGRLTEKYLLEIDPCFQKPHLDLNKLWEYPRTIDLYVGIRFSTRQNLVIGNEVKYYEVSSLTQHCPP
jgi:hypothetical protein